MSDENKEVKDEDLGRMEGIPEITDFENTQITDDQIKAYIHSLKRQVLVAQLTSQQLAARCGNYAQDTGNKNKAAERAMNEAFVFANRQMSFPTSPYAVRKLKELSHFMDPNYDWKREVDMNTLSVNSSPEGDKNNG